MTASLLFPAALLLWYFALCMVHEAGHALTARLLGFTVDAVSLTRCRVSGSKCAPGKWLLVALGGPVAVLGVLFVLLCLGNHFVVWAGIGMACVSLLFDVVPMGDNDMSLALRYMRLLFGATA